MPKSVSVSAGIATKPCEGVGGSELHVLTKTSSDLQPSSSLEGQHRLCHHKHASTTLLYSQSFTENTFYLMMQLCVVIIGFT